MELDTSLESALQGLKWRLIPVIRLEGGTQANVRDVHVTPAISLHTTKMELVKKIANQGNGKEV